MFIKTSINKYGSGVAHFKCDTCSAIYTVTPIPKNLEGGFNNCLSPECPSYKKECDMNILFGDNTGLEKHKNLFPCKMNNKK